MSVCVSLLLAGESGHIPVGYLFAVGSRCWEPWQVGQRTRTQIFSAAQGENEVCKELCSSWIYLPRTDVLGWVGFALHSSKLKAFIAGAHLLCLLLQGCSVKSEPRNKASPRASLPHRSASEWGLISSGVFFIISWSVFRCTSDYQQEGFSSTQKSAQVEFAWGTL